MGENSRDDRLNMIFECPSNLMEARSFFSFGLLSWFLQKLCQVQALYLSKKIQYCGPFGDSTSLHCCGCYARRQDQFLREEDSSMKARQTLV